MTQRPILVASHLEKRYGSRTAVEDVSFTLHAGEVVAVLGPNGAGKTTTLRLLAGLLRPTAGSVSVDGVSSASRGWQAARGRIGFLTEVPGLWDRLTVEANLLTYARLHGLARPAERVAALLEELGLADRARDPAGALSKGMRQKVALARTILHDPLLVLLDEPTAGLDPAMTRQVRDVIGRLRRDGRAVLVSTHNLDEADRVADRIAVLNTRLVALDAPEALRRRASRARVEIVIADDAAAFATVVGSAGGTLLSAVDTTLICEVSEPSRDVPRLVRALVEAGADIHAVAPQQATLEDVYLAMTAESMDPS